MQSKLVRVNLGSGRDYKEGWVNVDVDQSVKVDVVADLSQRFPFNDNSVDELLASDILEHFTKEDGIIFLKECHRVLKIHGKLTIRTHNIFQIFQQFHTDPQVVIHFLYGDTKDTGVFGSHKFAYTKKSLVHTLKLVGFEIDSIIKESTNFLVIAKKKEQKSANLTVGIIMQSPDLGGAETYMLSLISSFITNKDKVIIASNKGKFLTKAKEFRVHTFKLLYIMDIIGNLRGLIKTTILLPFEFIFYIKLLSKFKKNGVQVILMSNFTEKLFVSFVSLFVKIPVVWIEYGRLENVFKRNFYIPKIVYRLLNNIPFKVIVPTKNTMGSLITDARVSLAKIACVPLGISFTQFTSTETQIPFSKEKKALFIGNVSRLTTEKGQDYLIKAMKYVVKQIPNARLLLVGDGPDKNNYQKLVSELGLEKYVTITGFVNNLTDYYSVMDIFVFPTVWDLEGFGLVVPEAMSHKLPVVASNLGPVPEIVDDERTGILVKPKDEKALAKAIIDLANNFSKRKKMGEEGYKKVLEYFTLEKSFQKVRDILYEATIT